MYVPKVTKSFYTTAICFTSSQTVDIVHVLLMYFMYMGVLSACTYAYQKRALDPMGLQLQMVYDMHVCICVLMCVDTCVYVCRVQKWTSGVFLEHSSTY